MIGWQDKEKSVLLQSMMDQRILDFIGEHHVLTVACVSQAAAPWCANAFYVFDSLYQQYPETEAGIQALYMKAIYFQMNPERLDSAVAIYRSLRDKHGRTRWGKQAVTVLNSKVNMSDKDLDRLRKRVARSLEHIDKLSAQYYESLAKKPEEKQAEVKSKEDEVLENTYNSMYDFE